MPVEGLVGAARQVAAAQNRRSAASTQILPAAHWFFLHGMGFIFLATFLFFDASELESMAAGGGPAIDALLAAPDDRSALFGALCMLLALTQQVLVDLDDPCRGMRNVCVWGGAMHAAGTHALRRCCPGRTCKAACVNTPAPCWLPAVSARSFWRFHLLASSLILPPLVC